MLRRRVMGEAPEEFIEATYLLPKGVQACKFGSDTSKDLKITEFRHKGKKEWRSINWNMLYGTGDTSVPRTMQIQFKVTEDVKSIVSLFGNNPYLIGADFSCMDVSRIAYATNVFSVTNGPTYGTLTVLCGGCWQENAFSQMVRSAQRSNTVNMSIDRNQPMDNEARNLLSRTKLFNVTYT